jgi:hypothetical protein
VDYRMILLNISEQKKKSIKFVVNVIKNICLKRNFEEAVIKCNLFLYQIEDSNDEILSEELSDLKIKIIDLIDELKFTIHTEIRFVLFPLPDIKKAAYEMGKIYMKNFLEWIKPEDNYTPEHLMGILEDELYRLDDMKEILEKIK